MGFLRWFIPAPTDVLILEKKAEYKKFSKAAFNGLLRLCSESVKMDIKHFSEVDDAVKQAWLKCAMKFQHTSGSK